MSFYRENIFIRYSWYIHRRILTVLPVVCHPSIWSLSQTSCRSGRATGSHCPDLQRQKHPDLWVNLTLTEGSTWWGVLLCKGLRVWWWVLIRCFYKFVVWTCVWQQGERWIIKSVNKQERKRSGWAAFGSISFQAAVSPINSETVYMLLKLSQPWLSTETLFKKLYLIFTNTHHSIGAQIRLASFQTHS